MVYILLLTFFLQGGVVMTQSVQTPSKQECEKYKPLIVRDYLLNKVKLGNTDLPIKHLVGLCIKVSP
jgi:hypothetical protein